MIYKTKQELRSEDLFAIFGVDYINDNYLNIRDYLPGGFDIAVAVGGFYDRQYSPAFCFAVLNRLYRLANTNGIIQVELNHTTEGLGQILEALETQGTPFTYTPATEQGLARHALWHEGSEDGVLTIGPKL
ncbi:hypothetical protein HY024_03555 [Candidatus Curtissbacteria bacterium]|nr:hypothetical protein [Candidatus Curtissbacteria bacterium]